MNAKIFAPIVVSAITNKIPRKTLTDEEILKEVTYLKEKGYDHILLVTGEANTTVGVPYL